MGHDEGSENWMNYDRWQSKLSAEFFPANQLDEPVVMFLDDEELKRLCPALPDPMESLRSAVLAELRQTDKPAIFERIDRRLASWRTGPQDQPPPCLPLLAVTVLAASRMRRDGMFSSSAYYPRLVSLMTSGTNRLTATGMQKHFDQVAQMWKTLDDWIERNRDLVGTSTIHTHETFKRIGYPLSQTVLKASDRERLSAFFDRLQVDRNSPPSPDELLAKLRLWMDKPRGFSSGFVDLVEAGPGNPLLLAVIVKLATEQSAEPAQADNQVRLDLSLRIDSDDWSISWVIPVHPRLETDELKQDNGTLLTIRKPDYGSVYQVVDGNLSQNASLINHPYRATGTRAVLTKRVRQLWVLRRDSLSGHWQSVASVSPGEQHLLVVQESDVSELNELLASSAAPGYWRFRGTLFPGWAVYAGVTFVEPIDLSSAGSFNSLGQLLKVPSSLQARLVNGLKLHTDVGGQHYLLGGEPDVQLPEDHSVEYVQVVLDDKLPGMRIKPNGSLFSLRLVGTFTAGKHVVSVDSSKLEFFVHLSGSAAQGKIKERNYDFKVPGSDLEKNSFEYVLCRRGRGAAVWFVTPAGLVWKCTEFLIPPSLRDLGFPESYRWKVPVAEGASWVLTEWGGKLSKPLCITADPPAFGVLDAPALAFWRRVAQETIGNPDPLWRAYLSQSIKDSIYAR
ncbi:hypothetical protein ACX80I_09875 [Arthrobacter sp. MDT3-44]